MAKIVKEERLALVITLSREGGTGPVEVSGRADYDLTCDDFLNSGESVSRSHELNLTPTQENAIKTFATDVLQEIKDAEGV